MQPAIDSPAAPAPRISFSDMAIEILQATRDGNELEPHDLRLLELAVNGFLSEAGEIAFERLHRSVMSGAYATEPHWLHNIEHLTIDHAGYVYWRGQTVEHYSFTDIERERAAATELARRCRRLEEVGLPVNSRTVLCGACASAPSGSPWARALCSYYGFFAAPGRLVGLFYRLAPGSAEVFAIDSAAPSAAPRTFAGAYEAFHAIQRSGLEPFGRIDNYDQACALFDRLGITPEALAQEIDRPHETDAASQLAA